MSHFYTEDQKLFQESVKRFVDEEVRPRAVEIDRTHEFPYDLWKRLGELELTGITVPKEYGGLGESLVTELMVMEEIGRVCPTLALILDVNYFAIGSILDNGSDMLKEKYVPRLAKGELLGALSSTDPTGSSNLAEWPVSVVEDGDGYIINTSKMFCTSSAHFDVVVLNVMSEDGPVSLVIDRDTPGISTGHIERKMGLNGSDTGTLVMKDVRVPADCMMDFYPGAHGNVPFMDVGAICLGVAQEAFDKTIAYLKQRSKSGTTVLSSVGYVGAALADIAVDLELARNMVYNAGRMYDEGQITALVGPACKGWISEMAVRNVARCMELNGGLGFIEDTGLAKLLRDVTGLTIAEGSTGLMNMSIQLALGIVPPVM